MPCRLPEAGDVVEYPDLVWLHKRAPKGLGSLWSEFHCLTLCFWRPCFSLPQAFVLRTCAYCVPGGAQHRQRGRQEAAPQRTAHVRGGTTAAGGGGV